ncbi:MAG: gliding motility protein GldN [Thermoflexibacter sp.]|jgi:gliding motility associated protien GldN|nr:gliding motility protein GldN [Thermoflexibacter sp.]
MKIIQKLCLLFAVLGLSLGVATAQERDEFGYNINSLRPIHEHDQLWKRTVWVRMDCREKQNKPFFAKNNEISKVIIEAVKAGILRPFQNDSLLTRMSYENFIENLTIPGSDEGLTEEEKAMGFGDDSGGWGDSGWGDEGGGGAESEGSAEPAVASSNEYFPHQINILEIRIDLIFDKKRSRWYRDIQSITLILPAEANSAKGVDQPIASFSYKELVENVFKDNDNAIWYNDANNPREHRNLSEAFDLTLYAAHMIKYSNPDDAFIQDVYGADKAAIVASMQLEHQLVDFETEFWEY